MKSSDDELLSVSESSAGGADGLTRSPTSSLSVVVAKPESVELGRVEFGVEELGAESGADGLNERNERLLATGRLVFELEVGVERPLLGATVEVGLAVATVEVVEVAVDEGEVAVAVEEVPDGVAGVDVVVPPEVDVAPEVDDEGVAEGSAHFRSCSISAAMEALGRVG